MYGSISTSNITKDTKRCKLFSFFEYWKNFLTSFLLIQIVEICRCLVKNDSYTVQGYWQCKNVSDKHNLLTSHTLESLKEYLESPIKMKEFFCKRCKECSKKIFLISFRVSKQLPSTNSKNSKNVSPNLYIYFFFKNALKLIFNRKLRYIEQKNLIKGDFYMQKCNRCEEDYNDNCIILNYKPLVLSEGNSHKSKLCAKYQHGAYCRYQTGMEYYY